MEKYTVIIPTRDRAETLEATLRTCLRQTYKNFEIIVSDNCSFDNTREVVDCFNDPRIRYINPGRCLSMSGNFEFALGHVTEGFVMFVGSDDGIMPDAIHYVDSIVKKYKVDAVSCRQATYVWPSFPDKAIAGNLNFGGVRGDIEIRSSPEWIRKTLNFHAPYCFDLPNLYCGFVHKRIINKAIKNGQYFRSINPDAYSALATAIFIDKYAFSHKPFSIAGASSKSNGASAMHPGANVDESNKFFSENDINFCEGFVICPSLEICVAESFAKLAQAFPEMCSQYKIDYSTMLKKAIKNSNVRTAKEVNAAALIMAINFSKEIISSPRQVDQSINIAINRAVLRAHALIGLFRIISIPKSDEIGVTNVDDAALVAHVILQLSKKEKFVSVGDLVRGKLMGMVGLK